MSFQVLQEKCKQIYFCADKKNQKSLSKQPTVNSIFQMSLSKSVFTPLLTYAQILLLYAGMLQDYSWVCRYVFVCILMDSNKF